MNKIQRIVDEAFDGANIASYLRLALGLSSTLVKKVKFGGVFINGVNVHMRATVRKNDTVEVILPEEASENIRPIAMPLDIVYEDEYIIAVNKPSGMPTHPSKGNSLPTLAEGIVAYLMPKKFVFRAINRLDRDTGGIVIVAKDALSAARLSAEMKRGGFSKVYSAIVTGTPEMAHGVIDAPIARNAEGDIKRVVRDDGKRAVTEYKVIRTLSDGNALCEIRLHTGRTHQIRVHMAYIGHPLVADFLYGERIEGRNYSLHAKTISFTHPVTGEKMTLHSKADFEQ